MKVLLLISLLGLSSCVGSTEYGECIGIIDEGEPNLKYKVSVRNTLWSVLGVETIIAPILWVTDFAKCPIAKR